MSGLNIADIFETVVATVPDQTALIVRSGDGNDEVRFSFAELDARVNRLAHSPSACGIGVIGTTSPTARKGGVITTCRRSARAAPRSRPCADAASA